MFKLSKLGQIKAVNHKFASSTSIHGLTRVTKARTLPMKLTWTLMTLMSLFAGLFIIYNTIQDYNKNDVMTRTERIQPDESILPTVIFCTWEKDLNLTNIFQRVIIYSDWIKSTGETFQAFPDYGCTGCIKFNSASELFTVTDAYRDWLNFEASQNFGTISVFITDNYLNVFDLSHTVTTVQFNPGTIISIQVSKRVEKRLARPYSECQSMAGSYRQVNCIAQCRNSRFLTEYNCTLTNYYGTPGYDYCPKRLRYSEEFDDKCSQQCPEECVLIKFDTRVISYKDWEHTDSNNQVIQIQYSELSYIEIRQTPMMTGFTLIAAVGGALGLFIGIRFVSIVELVEYLTEIFWILFY